MNLLEIIEAQLQKIGLAYAIYLIVRVIKCIVIYISPNGWMISIYVYILHMGYRYVLGYENYYYEIMQGGDPFFSRSFRSLTPTNVKFLRLMHVHTTKHVHTLLN